MLYVRKEKVSIKKSIKTSFLLALEAMWYMSECMQQYT